VRRFDCVDPKPVLPHYQEARDLDAYLLARRVGSLPKPAA
jgi:hypothetical protein